VITQTRGQPWSSYNKCSHENSKERAASFTTIERAAVITQERAAVILKTEGNRDYSRERAAVITSEERAAVMTLKRRQP
jgi:hypothetical protein